jgi:hypothetical protein
MRSAKSKNNEHGSTQMSNYTFALRKRQAYCGSPQITGTLDKLTSITRVRQVTYRA